MNQSIEAVKARDRVDASVELFRDDLDMSRVARAVRQAVRTVPRPYTRFEWLEEAAQQVCDEIRMRPPSAAELARMAPLWPYVPSYSEAELARMVTWAAASPANEISCSGSAIPGEAF